MTVESALAQARELIERQAWEQGYALLSAEDRTRALEPDDLVLLATATSMLGREDEVAGLWSRAHTEYLAKGDRQRAVRCAYWLIVPMLFRGEMAQAGGWIARAQRLLEEEHECAEHGYLLVAMALRSVREGDYSSASARFAEASRIGHEWRDTDLIAQARHGEGRTLIRLGEVARGASLLDEVMAMVIAGAVSPLVAGIVYCSVLESCQEMYDVRRAREWTDAMTEWCSRQPDGVGFRGQCLVHRAELMQLHGAWSGATEEAQRARDRFLRPPAHRAIGLAYYRIAELHRLRGELEHAEESYREASRAGLDPQPGLALLRLAQGQRSVARTALARAVGEARDAHRRARLLPALVEISIAVSDIAQARKAADELAAIASGSDAPMLRATAAHASGAAMLAEGDARGALVAMREAFTTWQDLDVPYDAARARVLIAQACRVLGDVDSAAMELSSAKQTFAELGAVLDLARATELQLERREDAGHSELTPRETEVLRLVATGRTNRAIAASLGISEKTIARHISNIFLKLELANRAAATAYAYEHGLLGRST